MGGDRMPTAEAFRRATSLGGKFAEVNAGILHRKVGDSPGRNHCMPVVCDVVYRAMQEGDEILSRPPKGRGATLTIRYRLPRR